MGLLNKAKKFFKKVTKGIKRIAPVLVAAAAIYFTAGAALPMLGTGGATAGNALISSLGISPTGVMGSIISSAVTQAGYGAVIGAATSAAIGGSVTEGLQKGAIVGGATGAATGAFTSLTAPATAGAPSPATVSTGPAAAPFGGGVRPPPAGAPVTPGLLSGVEKWMAANPQLTEFGGKAAANIGAALLTQGEGEAAAEINAQAVKEAQANRQAGFAVTEGLLASGARDPSMLRAKAPRWRMNPETRRIERVEGDVV